MHRFRGLSRVLVCQICALGMCATLRSAPRISFIFFFQAEDGIRDYKVTGVQMCALPISKVELRDPVKLKDFVVDGKLELSLAHYLELVMANNTDVAIQLLSLEVPKNAIQMAFGAWDPTARASFSTTRSTSLPSSALDSRSTGVSKSLAQPYSVSYSQTLETGT